LLRSLLKSSATWRTRDPGSRGDITTIARDINDRCPACRGYVFEAIDLLVEPFVRFV
jgi:hypothetical protein